MGQITCQKCNGEGTLYTSKYGGNDPDVWPTGKCDACYGSGEEQCASRACIAPAVGFNDDGEALCEDCMAEWATNFDEHDCGEDTCVCAEPY